MNLTAYLPVLAADEVTEVTEVVETAASDGAIATLIAGALTAVVVIVTLIVCVKLIGAIVKGGGFKAIAMVILAAGAVIAVASDPSLLRELAAVVGDVLRMVLDAIRELLSGNASTGLE